LPVHRSYRVAFFDQAYFTFDKHHELLLVMVALALSVNHPHALDTQVRNGTAGWPSHFT